MFKKKSLKINLLKLFIITLIIFILNIYIINVYALLEIIDNYENENYVQSKYNIVRNSVINCMEIEFSNQTDWFNSSWGYRKSHNITGSTWGNVSNYQMRIKVYYGSGSDNNDIVYLDGKCQNDFDDIRFCKSDGLTKFNYTRYTYVISDYAFFYILIDFIEVNPSNTLMYIYYNNSDVSTDSNGDDTFLLWDDFNDGSIDSSKWKLHVNVVESGGYMNFGPVQDSYIHSDLNESIGNDWGVALFKRDRRVGGATPIEECAFWLIDGTGNYVKAYSNNKVGQVGVRTLVYDNGISEYTGQPTSSTFHDLNVWYNKEFILTKTVLKYVVNDDVKYSLSISLDYWDYNNIDPRFGQWDEHDSDYIWLRKFIDPEPTHSGWGVEENKPYYAQPAWFYTKNILDSINGSSIVLLYYCDIPEDDSITIKFSPNNSSWYNHNNITGYDNLIDGNESLDMRDLNFIGNCYLLFNFSDGGLTSTPRIHQLILITSGDNGNGISEPDESYSALLIIGLITGLVLGIGIYISKK